MISTLASAEVLIFLVEMDKKYLLADREIEEYSNSMNKQIITIITLVLAVALTGAAIFAWQQRNTIEDDQQSTESANTTVTPSPTVTPTNTNEPSGSETVSPVEQTVSLFMVAVGDTAAGPEIGCGDSLVGVTKKLTTTTPLADAIKSLLGIKDQYYGESGLYNALYQSNLQLSSATISNGVASIALTGELKLGGTCDSPRVKGQLEATATQFASVSSANITVNGQSLDQALSTK